jgi:hypothetical protein
MTVAVVAPMVGVTVIAGARRSAGCVHAVVEIRAFWMVFLTVLMTWLGIGAHETVQAVRRQVLKGHHAGARMPYTSISSVASISSSIVASPPTSSSESTAFPTSVLVR